MRKLHNSDCCWCSGIFKRKLNSDFYGSMSSLLGIQSLLLLNDWPCTRLSRKNNYQQIYINYNSFFMFLVQLFFYISLSTYQSLKLIELSIVVIYKMNESLEINLKFIQCVTFLLEMFFSSLTLQVKTMLNVTNITNIFFNQYFVFGAASFLQPENCRIFLR